MEEKDAAAAGCAPQDAHLLYVDNLIAAAGDKEILHGIDLTVDAGQTHVLMGPNGAGKSTLGRLVMGDAAYEPTGGSIWFDGQNVTALSEDKRSLAGIFLSYQAPVEVPGVPLYTFLRAIARKRPELKMSGTKFRAHVGELCDQLHLDQSYLVRDLNVGFSGGERKKVEMLQLLLLKPKLAILDETDSGLDVDALEIVASGIQAYRESCDGALLIITHNTRLLNRLHVDRTHVMVHGTMVASGDGSLVAEIDREGFGRYEEVAAAREAQAAAVSQVAAGGEL
jgi:Fe-S cluster assembly ATP-binding protein